MPRITSLGGDEDGTSWPLLLMNARARFSAANKDDIIGESLLRSLLP